MSSYDFFQIRRQFINTYLDSPVIEGDAVRATIELLEVQSGSTARRPIIDKIFNALPSKETDIQMYDPRELKHILSGLDSHGVKTYSTAAHDIARSVYDGVEARLQEISGYHADTSSIPAPCIHSRTYLCKADLFVRFVDELACKRAIGNKGLVQVHSSTYVLTGNQYFGVLSTADGLTSTVLPYEGILMIKDLLLSRSNVYDAIRVCYPGDEAFLFKVHEVLEWCLECLVRYGNKGYEILKQLEPLSKAHVIQISDPVFSDHGPLQRLSEQVRVKERKLSATDDFMADRLITILDSNKSLTHSVEMFGLMKVSGHPLIDPRVGGKSAAYEASINRGTEYSAAKRLRNNWCRLYVEGYVRKTGRWPPLTFTESGKNTRLYQLYSLRERALSRTSYPLPDWEGARFGAHAEFEYYTNFLDLMDDKSISFYLSEFRATWRRNIKPRSHRRLLLEMLQRPEVSIRNIVMMVENGDIPEDYFIVSLYPKEREFKEAARMFSMMVFEMRAFFSCLEANLANKIFPHLPQQTMTLKKSEIQERLFEATRPSSANNVVRLFLEIDLSRWNLRWRDLTIRLIGRDLNDIFGMKESFTFVHVFFRKCLILVRVAGYEPDGLDSSPPPSSDLLWYDHEGGFEGISQKHWTLATYSMIDLGVQSYGFNYALFGQGDNQIILAYIVVPVGEIQVDYIRALSNKVMLSVSMECEKVGQDAKPEECLESTQTVTYNKDFFIGGADYTMSLKALSRIFPRGTSEFPTLLNCVSAIGSGCVAASERMKDPLKAYYLQLYHSARYLLCLRSRCSLESLTLSNPARRSLNSSLVRSLVVLPGTLGGLPLPSPVSYLYKGGSDLLSKDVSCLKLYSHSDARLVLRCLDRISSKKWTSLDHSIISILEDPYSIPISRIPLAENRVQKISLQHVLEVAKNREIKDVVGLDVSVYEEEIKKRLLEVVPFNPAFLSDLLDKSVVGVKSLISRMFTSTRTVQSLTQGDEKDPGGMILRSSATCFTQIVGRLKDLSGGSYPFVSVYSTVKHLRSLWTTLYDAPPGITIEGVTNYVPLDFCIRTDFEESRSLGEVQILFEGSRNVEVERGTNKPYLGKETQEKRTSHGYKIVTSSSAEKAVSSLYRMLTQPGIDVRAEQLIINVARTRTDTDLLELKGISSKAIGGSIAHRYTSVFDLKSASVLVSCSFAAHLVLQSDYADPLSGSQLDYPIMFQELFTFGSGLLNFAYRRGRTSMAIAAIQIPDNMEPLPDENLTIRSATLPYAPRLLGNSLVFAEDLSLIRQEQPYTTEMIGEMTGAESLENPQNLVQSAAARELRRHSSAASILDTGRGEIRLSLDILEFRGLGFEALITGISSAIANHCFGVLFSRHHGSHRMVALPALMRLGNAFAHSVARAAEHPMFQSDRYVVHYLKPTELRYSYYHLHRRIAHSLSTKAYLKLTYAPQVSKSEQVLIFQDDEDSSAIEMSLQLIRKGLVLGVKMSEISADQAYKINTGAVLQRIRQSVLTPEKLKALFHSVLVIKEYAESNSLPVMSDFFKTLSEGSKLRLVDTTLAESMRVRRRYNMTKTLISKNTTTSIDDAPLPVKITVLQTGLHPITTLELAQLSFHAQTDAEILFNYTRRSTRTLRIDAQAVYSFWPARRALRADTLVILGSGNGGCAAVAQRLGIPRIILHDRQSDIRTEFWSTPVTSIPVLKICTTTSHVERSRAGYGQHNGDLEHDSTWTSLARLAPVGATILYDIQCNSVESLLELGSRMTTSFPGSPLITRWIKPKTVILELVSLLRSIDDNLEVYVVSECYGWTEIIVRMTFDPHTSLQVPRQRVDLDWTSATRAGVEFFEVGGPSLWESSFGDILPASDSEDFLTTIADKGILNAALDKSDHGFSYDQWTRVLWCLLSLEYAKLNQSDRVSRYLRESKNGVSTVTIRGNQLIIKREKAFSVFFRKELPGLSNSL